LRKEGMENKKRLTRDHEKDTLLLNKRKRENKEKKLFEDFSLRWAKRRK
jgi:hypothetical protein